MFHLLIFAACLHYSSQSLIVTSDVELEQKFGTVVFVSAVSTLFLYWLLIKQINSREYKTLESIKLVSSSELVIQPAAIEVESSYPKPAASQVTRHGDRTPKKYFPKYNNTNNWKIGLGELTKAGKMQTYELGEYFRDRYESFLGDTYQKLYLKAHSSDYDRTLMSAECILAGMLPPTGDDVWNTDLTWQPIPVHTIPMCKDTVIGVTKYCERIKSEYEIIDKKTDVQELYNSHKTTIQYIADNVGVDISKFTIPEIFNMLKDVYETFETEEKFELPLPLWAESVYPKELKKYTIEAFKLTASTHNLLKINLGKLYKFIANDMQGVVSKTSQKRFQLYSGHNTNIKNILISLNAFNDDVVPLASAILIELRKKLNNYYVTVLYKNSESKLYMVDLKAVNNSFLGFKETVSNFFVDDWDSLCKISADSHGGSSQSQTSSGDTESHFSVILMSILILLAIGVGVGSYFLYFRVWMAIKFRPFQNDNRPEIPVVPNVRATPVVSPDVRMSNIAP